ncbi:hypothetical protein [Saccharothrix algeriensis]|uniref:Uncharacterized protein n=1 Tax=Saccharothrix algeriensis TaxID=173560 RepID=A0ABS2S2P5_9PSEU|nr:hypothetical protein [Saccharothrix algeriensis]MBM7810526.1 hypothetical protein [Saccharothrix algeriensis]
MRGQQVFQAVLFACLNSLDRDHPWDSMGGRSFADLRHYIDWVSPQPDRLMIECAVSGRVASYLLPHPQIFGDGSFVHAGIPGLRVAGYAPRTIKLVHLPTGGRLDIIDGMGRTEAQVRRHLATEARRQGRPMGGVGRVIPFWYRDDLHPIEDSVNEHWAYTPVTRLLSGLMARCGLLWNMSDKVTLSSSRRSTCAAKLTWDDGYEVDELADLLTGPAVGIPRAEARAAESWVGYVLLRLDDGQIELDNRSLGMRRRRARALLARGARTS